MSDYLILVNVAGTVTLFDYLTGNIIPQSRPKRVIPGDRVAWNVQVYVGNRAHALGYEVTFFETDKTTPNSTFFGKTKLAVPKGGTSPFLEVLPLQETVKYSITASGLGLILDPEMQTGDGTVIIVKEKPGIPTPRPVSIVWDIDHNGMSYQGAVGPVTPFPPAGLKITVGEMMVFSAISAANPAPDIQVVFVPDPAHRLWASPYYQSQGTVPVSGPANPTPQLQVNDSFDVAGSTVFVFNVQTADGNTMSNAFKFLL